MKIMVQIMVWLVLRCDLFGVVIECGQDGFVVFVGVFVQFVDVFYKGCQCQCFVVVFVQLCGVVLLLVFGFFGRQVGWEIVCLLMEDEFVQLFVLEGQFVLGCVFGELFGWCCVYLVECVVIFVVDEVVVEVFVDVCWCGFGMRFVLEDFVLQVIEQVVFFGQQLGIGELGFDVMFLVFGYCGVECFQIVDDDGVFVDVDGFDWQLCDIFG